MRRFWRCVIKKDGLQLWGNSFFREGGGGGQERREEWKEASNFHAELQTMSWEKLRAVRRCRNPSDWASFPFPSSCPLFWAKNFTSPLMNRSWNQRQFLQEDNERNWQVPNSACGGRHAVPVLDATAICWLLLAKKKKKQRTMQKRKKETKHTQHTTLPKTLHASSRFLIETL